MPERDVLKSTLAATPQCLTPGQLETLLDGKQSHPHLTGCARCQAELAMLKAFESGTPLPDEGAAVAWISSHLDRHLETIKSPRARMSQNGVQSFEPQGSWWARIFAAGGWRWAVPAMAVVAAAIMAAILLRPEKEPGLQADAGHFNGIYRSQEVQVVSPAGDLQQAPRELQWQPYPGTETYRVAVREVDNSLLWSMETRETSVEIPGFLRAKMLPGKPILWQVTALDATGRVLGTSQVQRFASPRRQSPGKTESPNH